MVTALSTLPMRGNSSVNGPVTAVLKARSFLNRNPFRFFY